MTTTANTQVPQQTQTGRQRMLEEIRRRLDEERKRKKKGKYEAPARVGGPTRLNK